MLKLDHILLTFLIFTCLLVSFVIVGLVIEPAYASSSSMETYQEYYRTGGNRNQVPETWQEFRDDGYGFEIAYPPAVNQKSIPNQNSLNAGLGFPRDTPVWEFRIATDRYFQQTNLLQASVVIHVSTDLERRDTCLEPNRGNAADLPEKKLPVVEINGIEFWKEMSREGGMGESYEVVSYRTLANQACYEITQLVKTINLDVLPEGSRTSYNRDGVFLILDQVVNSFHFLEAKPEFPERTYPIPKELELAVEKSSPENVDGLDVSHWQGDIRWGKVGDAGYVFAFVKGTEGVGWTDSRFVENMENGPNSGVVRGVYHFARPDLGNSGQDEAEYFLSVAGDYLESGYLRPVLDLEVRGSLDKNSLSDWVLDWMQTVENQTGIPPLIYTNLHYINYYLTNAVTEYDLWIAYWTCDPTITFNIPPTGKWADWAFWQYSAPSLCGDSYVSGVQYVVDKNIFNGVESGLAEYDAASPLWVSLISDSYQAPAPYYADLTADVNGDASGLIDFAIWWDCPVLEAELDLVEASCGELPDPPAGECQKNDFGQRCLEMDQEVVLAEYTYQHIGNFIPKVIVERGGNPPVEDRYHISTINPILGMTVTPPSPGAGIPELPFEIEVDVTARTSVGGALQVDVYAEENTASLDSGCVQIPGDQLVTERYPLSIAGDDGGDVPYLIYARYRAAGDCPIEDTSPDDVAADYLISWPYPEIHVEGQGNPINNGELIVSSENGTNFGATALNAAPVVRVFTIKNTGSLELELSSDPVVMLTDDPVNAFSMDAAGGPVNLLPGESLDFEISFDPQEIGDQAAQVTITSNDANENPYVFSIQGRGVNPASLGMGGDFDGDQDSDMGVFRPQNGRWIIVGQEEISWGGSSDWPVPGDYDGDGRYEKAVWRPSNGYWYIKQESGYTSIWWGNSDSIPVQGDYDGDGAFDVAVIDPNTGFWHIRDIGSFNFYQAGDIPVPCDYDGDGSTDIAVYRPSNGYWYIRGQTSMWWGFETDIPLPGDYNGDGICDKTIWRPDNGYWYTRWNTGYSSVWWGLSEDIPVPGDYDGNGEIDPAVIRPATGVWYVRDPDLSVVIYSPGDFPLLARDTNGDGDPWD